MTLHEAQQYDKAQRIKDYQRANNPLVHSKISAELDKHNPHFERNDELRPDTTPHKCQWSQVVKRAFAKGIIRGMLP